jgi:hypothetical protein
VPDLEIDITAQLAAALGRVADGLDREARWRQRQAEVIRQIPLTAPQMPLAGGAGILDSVDNLAVKTGYCWGIRRLTLSGFTAGTAVVYNSSVFGEPLVPYPQAATFTFGRGEVLLKPGDRLVVQATGISGYVQLNGIADCFEQWYLPIYVG